MSRWLSVGLLAVLAALIAAPFLLLRWSVSDDAFADCRGGVVAGDIAARFTLVDGTGRTVTERDVITAPSLVYLGYTFCPDVCPMDNARNAEAVDLLHERGLDVTPVFISVDPARDTPEVVADYAGRLHPRMIGLTGSQDQVRDASAAFKSYYKVNDDGSDYYLVDHSTFTYLVLPDQGFVDFFRRDVSAAEMADRVACFLKE